MRIQWTRRLSFFRLSFTLGGAPLMGGVGREDSVDNMLKIILIVAGVVIGIVLLLVALLFIRLSRGPIVFAGPVTSKLTAVAVRDEGTRTLRCTLRFTGKDKPYSVTEIHLPRELAQVMGISPPNGFTDEPYVAGPKVGDEAWVQKFNRETVRWVGQLALPPEQDVVLTIPAQHARAGKGTIQFRYEHRGMLGGSIRSCMLTLESQ
jgi:hypothetical protein